MIITESQLKDIQSGELFYMSCDYCGYGMLSRACSSILCPDCGNALCPSGEGWDFGYGWSEDRREFGLSYEFEAGDYASGN